MGINDYNFLSEESVPEFGLEEDPGYSLMGAEEASPVAADPLSLVSSNLGIESPSDFASRAAQLRALENQYRQEAADLLQKSQENRYGPDIEQLTGQALAAFLPALIGYAAKGKKLGSQGAEIGMKLSAGMQEEQKKEAARQQALDAAGYKEKDALSKAAGQQASTAERDAAFAKVNEERQRKTDARADERLSLEKQRLDLARQRGSGSDGPSLNDIRIADRVRELDKLSIPGTTMIKSPNETAYKKGLELENARDGVNLAFEELEESFKTKDPARINEASSRVIIQIKNLEQMGANFTASEQELIRSLLPAWNNYTLSNLNEMARKSLLGQDPISTIRRVKGIYDDSAKRRLIRYGYAPIGWRPSPGQISDFQSQGITLLLDENGAVSSENPVVDQIVERYSKGVVQKPAVVSTRKEGFVSSIRSLDKVLSERAAALERK